MPNYTFRCSDHGLFTLTRSMSEPATGATCPVCRTPARRVFGSPALASFTAAHHRAFDAAAASAENPMVVKSIPESAGRPRTPTRRNPNLPGLPRW